MNSNESSESGSCAQQRAEILSEALSELELSSEQMELEDLDIKSTGEDTETGGEEDEDYLPDSEEEREDRELDEIYEYRYQKGYRKGYADRKARKNSKQNAMHVWENEYIESRPEIYAGEDYDAFRRRDPDPEIEASYEEEAYYSGYYNGYRMASCIRLYDNVHSSWSHFFSSGHGLQDIWKVISSGMDIAPPLPLVMRVFSYPLDRIRVAIIGQDPYPTEGDADGLAFSSLTGIPRSLANIQKEILDEYPSARMSGRGDLSCWAEQGILLINTALTTLVGRKESHLTLWGDFAQRVLDYVMKTRNRKQPGQVKKKLVVLAWGRKAQSVIAKEAPCHLLTAAHPSPLSASRGFFGCGHFRETNRILTDYKEEPIDWSF